MGTQSIVVSKGKREGGDKTPSGTSMLTVISEIVRNSALIYPKVIG